MNYQIKINVDVPEGLLAVMNALGALGDMKDELGLVPERVTKEPEAPEAPAAPAAPAHTMDELTALAMRCAKDVSLRDRSRQIVADAGLKRLSDAGPEHIGALYSAFTDLLNTTSHA